MISTKTGDAWAYFAHCASLCFILALAVVKAPLMHDFSVVYRGSLDGAVLAAGKSIWFLSAENALYLTTNHFHSTRFGDAHFLLDHSMAGTHCEAPLEL